ncbi:MAG TPA: DUF2007 domain-containing protein [Acidobacteriaceae bacterium]|jgi:hypothetical protein|nr:DUF2007 domain-containing protein [Acidobacteriaceae bacterium]
MTEQPEELVTVAQFRETAEAELAKGRLDSAGIESFLAGENTAMLYGTGLDGLLLQVKPEDEADARSLLADPGDPEAAEEAEEAEERDEAAGHENA